MILLTEIKKGVYVDKFLIHQCVLLAQYTTLMPDQPWEIRLMQRNSIQCQSYPDVNPGNHTHE